MRSIGCLMVEHRVIDRMLSLLRHELAEITKGGKVNWPLIDVAIDFFSTYVDKFHHGKEEKILFTELEKKSLSKENKQIIDDLKEEHAFFHSTIERLKNEREWFATGEVTLDDLTSPLEAIINWYHVHTEKEDKQLFFLIAEYLSLQEQTAIMEEFWGFDGAFTHEMYVGRIRELESREVTPVCT